MELIREKIIEKWVKSRANVKMKKSTPAGRKEKPARATGEPVGPPNLDFSISLPAVLAMILLFNFDISCYCFGIYCAVFFRYYWLGSRCGNLARESAIFCRTSMSVTSSYVLCSICSTSEVSASMTYNTASVPESGWKAE